MSERIILRTGEALVEGDIDYLCADALFRCVAFTATTAASPTIGSNTSRDNRDRSVPTFRPFCPFVWAFFGTDW